jgi:hypothetical protein
MHGTRWPEAGDAIPAVLSPRQQLLRRLAFSSMRSD